MMEPKRYVTTQSLENMSGGRGRVPRASSLRYSLAEGVDGVDAAPSVLATMGTQSTPASRHAERLAASLHCIYPHL